MEKTREIVERFCDICGEPADVRGFIVEPSRSEQFRHTATDDESGKEGAMSDELVATCPDCGTKVETGWAYCPECAEWKAV